jgi:hypothetical protein
MNEIGRNKTVVLCWQHSGGVEQVPRFETDTSIIQLRNFSASTSLSCINNFVHNIVNLLLITSQTQLQMSLETHECVKTLKLG